MGAGQNRSRPRGRPALVACLVALLGVGMSPPAELTATAQASHATPVQSKPKTVSQCEQKFRPESAARVSCIKRVKSEKPGSSCAHPLVSAISAAGPSGRTDDVRLKFNTIHKPENPGSGEPVTYKIEVTNLNPRVVDCSLTVSEFRENETTGRIERGKVFHLPIGPGGGMSSSVTTPSDVVAVPAVRFRLK